MARAKASKPSRLSSGIIPVRIEGGARRYLLLRAFGYWDFPKGLVERGEEPLEAALRELAEETGLAAARLTWGGGFHETEPYSSGKVARYYLAEVPEGEPRLRPNPVSGIVEHHEARWLTPPEASRILVPRVRRALEWAEETVLGSGGL